MPLSHRHAHAQRGLVDTVGDIIDGVNPPRDVKGANEGLTVELVKKSPQNGGGSNNAVPTAISEPTRTGALGTEIAKATGEATMAPTDNIVGDRTMTAPTSAPTKDSDKPSDGDDSGGGDTSAGVKAGIAFGALGGILLIGLIIYFVCTRRKGRKGGVERGEEKFIPVGAAPPPPMKDRSKTPRLSLRPVTQFFPNFNSDKRNSRDPGFSMGPGRPSPSPSPFGRPGTSQSTHPSNPFGNQAERAASPITEEHSMHSRNAPPTPDRNTKPLTLGRQTSMRGHGTRNVDYTLPESRGPPSPAGTEFSMSSYAAGSGPGAPSSGAAAIAAAGGPKNTSVHRVQLDFTPSLEDEMELKAGELVRLLHEYDDGWALCIRLDRSRQGVVPRTCLSTRPVKPRPAQGGARGPPVNPQGAARGPYQPGSGQRPMTPQDRPSSPGAYRTQSPMGRPMSPASGRAQSPGPRAQGQPAGRARAGSKSHGPSPMNPGARPAPSAPPPGMAM